MLLHPSKHVGDAWYYVKEDIVHCFYLTAPANENLLAFGEIGHSVSTDLARWDTLGLALMCDAAEKWDEAYPALPAHPAIGSVLYHADRYWLAYTGNTSTSRKNEATVCLAVSDDLVHWEKVTYNPVTRVDPLYYERWGAEGEQGEQGVHWCNPFLFSHDGWVYHYVCASRKSGPPDHRATLGLARTNDMINWEVLPPPILEPILQSMDVPQLYHENGRFYLVFFAHAHNFASDLAARYRSELTSTMYSMVGPTPFGPFRMIGSGRIVPATSELQVEAAQIVHWRGQHHLLCSMRSKGRREELQPIPVQFTATGVKVHA